MLDGFYRRRLTRDLARWTEKGWVSAHGASAIRAALSPAAAGNRIPVLLGLLGAVLLAFAAMTFVAANWNEIPRLARLALLVGATGAAYAVAWALMRRGLAGFADAAVLAGSGIYGAAIMLVAQIYHIPADFPGGLLLWGLGTMFAAWAGRSRSALALALGLLTAWSILMTAQYGWTVHWPYPPLWATAFLMVEQQRWRSGRHLAVIAALAWLAVTLVSLVDNAGWPPFAVAAVGVPLFAGLWGLARLLGAWGSDGRPAAYAAALYPYALAGLLLALFASQLIAVESIAPEAWMLAALLLGALAVAAADHARRSGLASRFDVAALAAIAFGPLLLADAAAFIGGGALSNLTALLILAPLTLFAAIWAMVRGRQRRDAASAALGATGFAIEIVYLYFETFGTLLDTALFFLFGGVLLIGLAFLFHRLHARLAPGMQTEGPG